MKLVYKLDTTRTYAQNEYADLVSHAAKHHGIKINHDLFNPTKTNPTETNPTETQITYTLLKIRTVADLFIALALDTRSMGDLNLNNLYYLPAAIKQLKSTGFNKKEIQQCLNYPLTENDVIRIIKSHTLDISWAYKSIIPSALLETIYNNRHNLPSMVVGSRFFSWLKWRYSIHRTIPKPSDLSTTNLVDSLRTHMSYLGFANQAILYEMRYGLVTKIPSPKLRHQDMDDLGWLNNPSSAWDTSTYPIYTSDYPKAYAYRAYPYFLSNHFNSVQTVVKNPLKCNHARRRFRNYLVRSVIAYAHKLPQFKGAITSGLNYLPLLEVTLADQSAFSARMESLSYSKTKQGKQKYAKIVRHFIEPMFTKTVRRNYTCLADFLMYIIAMEQKNTWGSLIKLQPIVNAYNAQARKD